MEASGGSWGNASWRFRHIFLLGLLGLLEGCLVGPQIQFIKATAFARDHGPVDDCGETPKSEVCKQGLADSAFWSGCLSGLACLLSVGSAIVRGGPSDAIGRRSLLVCKGFLAIATAAALVLVVWGEVTSASVPQESRRNESVGSLPFCRVQRVSD